jgi:hypothetical protein
MNRTRPRWLTALPLAALALVAAGTAQSAPREIHWKKTVLDTHFRAEGVAVADVNRDGRPDVLAGNLWYEAPNWTPHPIRPVQEFNGATGYSNCFLSWSMDVDGDGWPDQIVVGFPGAPAVWRKNPGPGLAAGTAWAEFPITSSACNESPAFADVDGDGKPELVTPFNESQMAYYKPGANPEKGWEQHLIGAPKLPGCQRFSHGLGVGDVDGDGHADILCTDGYYKGPSDPKATNWTFVPTKLGGPCAQMLVYDVNGDGTPDVVSSSAHQFGVWWYEGRKGAAGPEFTQHTIDDSVSETHSMMMVDINGDGQPDFVTGKRWWAHGPNGDVDPAGTPYLYWFEFHRDGGKVTWTRHEIDNDSGVGTQFAIADLNGDHRPDVIVSNKKGVFIFVQQ